MTALSAAAAGADRPAAASTNRSPVHFFVHGIPAPQGSKRHVGRGVMVESSAKVKPWREAVKWAALDKYPEREGAFLLGPLLVTLRFYLPRPGWHYGTGRNADQLRPSAPAWPSGKPDLDKLVRSTLDGIGESGLWRDDAQVVRLNAEKDYVGANDAVGPGASVVVEET